MYSAVVEVIISGILLGGLYGAMGIGLSLVFGVMKTINLAHGDLIVLASYIAYFIMSVYGIDPVIGLAVVVPVMAALGFTLAYWPLDKLTKVSSEAPLLFTFALSMILENLFLLIFSPYSRGLTTSFSLSSIALGPYYVPFIYLMDFILGVVMAAILAWILSSTYTGLAIQATSQSSTLAQMIGINVRLVYAIAFVIAMVINAVAGTFVGLTMPFTPDVGAIYLTIAFGVVIIGGLGSVLGTMVGGVLLGLIQTLSSYYLGTGWGTFAIYFVVILIIYLMPRGIMRRIHG
ncbi:MAG: branched-chain amino acid ABC transporter permease [Thermocladium sp.]